MVYRILADLVVCLHLGFIFFAILGGMLIFRWRWVVWLHLPAILWSAWIEYTGGICPLTPLENTLRIQGETAGYTAGFIEHYLIPVIYPTHLTRNIQLLLGTLVLAINAGAYWRIFIYRNSK